MQYENKIRKHCVSGAYNNFSLQQPKVCKIVELIFYNMQMFMWTENIIRYCLWL